MISNDKLVKHFGAIIQFEEDVKNEYDEFTEKLHDQTIIDKIKYISDWEVKHIQLANELVNIVQRT